MTRLSPTWVPTDASSVPAAGAPPADAVADAARRRLGRRDSWLDRYARRLVALDGAVLLTAGLVAVLTRFGEGTDAADYAGRSYFLIALALALGWLLLLGVSRCYETRFLGSGAEEYRRVGQVSLRVTAAVALVSFSLKLQLSRGFVAAFLLVGTVLLLAGRAAVRSYLRAGRRHGRFQYRVVVVGARREVSELAAALSRDVEAGMSVVAACMSGGAPELALPGGRSAPVRPLTTLLETLEEVDADTVAVAAGPGMTGEVLRRLSHELEGTPVDLMVAPALTNVTGTRVHIRPIAGLPLLHLDEPEIGGARQAVKRLFDLVIASVLLLVLAPLLLGVAALVRLSSPGPALFQQERVGRNGELFRVLKFRSMSADAERRRVEVEHLNEHDGLLFKVRDDPRITRVGRWLRKYSIDELPQLLNVLKGDMSLVGPRPPLASEVARYEGDTRRRLLVRPGITGLWQVSGRSDLSWDDTVRLDLQYVENWSLALDLSILFRTLSVVLAGRGAY